MICVATSLPGVVIIEPKVFPDARGFFVETYHQDRYRSCGIQAQFVQDNLSRSSYGVLRGLHYQHPYSQGKLVQVLEGEVWDVAVDIRRDAETFGCWTAVTLSADNKKQFYIPPGFAHGFCVLSPTALFSYKCTDFYHPECDAGVRWNDPDIGIEWPIAEPILSDKDKKQPLLRDIPVGRVSLK